MRNSVTQIAAIRGSLLLAMSLDPKEIGQRIQKAREARGWTQLQMALEANVSPSTIARWEAGGLPKVSELVRISELLGIDPGELVQSEDATAPLEALGEEVAGLSRKVDDLIAELRSQRPKPARARPAKRAG